MSADTAPRLRVRVIRDDDAERPDYDAQCPVVRLDWTNGGWHRVEVMVGKESLSADRLEQVLAEGRRFGSSRDFLERWLNVIGWKWTTLSTRDGVYYEIASDEWITAMGFDDGVLPDGFFDRTSDYQNYLDGEVFRLVPEVLVGWTPDTDGFEPEEKWEHHPTESGFGGIYGESWAIESAFFEVLSAEDGPFLVVDEDGNEIAKRGA